jgi:hypothetical protein
MKFFGLGGEWVWDEVEGRRVCVFDRYGEIDTDNEWIIGQLKKRGYKSDADPIEGAAMVKAVFDAITGGDGTVTRKRKGA